MDCVMAGPAMCRSGPKGIGYQLDVLVVHERTILGEDATASPIAPGANGASEVVGMHASANQPVRYSISIASIPHATASRRLIITERVMRFVIRRLVANGMQQLLDCARSAGRRRLDDRSHHGTGWSRHLTSVHP